MRTPASPSSPKESTPVEIALADVYEAPVIATYSEAELIAALGPAHAGSPTNVDSWLELPTPPP